MNKGRVIVGLSGGVDSSVAAYLLKEEGYEVIGLFMKNWHDESVTLSNECPWLEDNNDAMLVAEKLAIPFQTVDLSKEYKERIVDYMFDEYSKGRTPNPDVLCNREIKFDVFLEIALSLGADYVATGHYCQKSSFEISSEMETYQLKAGADKNKDQSYFLCQLTQQQLSRVLFPIGHLQKDEVRKIGKSLGIPLSLIERHPFPGPGLAVRIIGDITKEKVGILQDVDSIFIEELRNHNLYNKISQALAVFLPIKSVGVMGDQRQYNYVVALRAVKTIDFMTATVSEIPYSILNKISTRIVNEVTGVARVVYDITSKPPGTIEWE